jgi:hypothetical protein
MILLSRSKCGDKGTLHASNFSAPEYTWYEYGAPCGCSTTCARYKDCCLNSKHYVEEKQRWGTDRPSCKNVPNAAWFVHMEISCPVGWDDDQSRAKCETYDVVPLMSRRTNTSYSNVHCAVCNKDFDPDTDILWPMTFWCKGNEPGFRRISINSGDHNTTYVRVTTRIYPHYIFFNYSIPVSTFSLLRLHPGTEDSRFRNPSIVQFHASGRNDTCSGSYYSLDPNIMSVCNPNLISTCATDWKDREVEARCLAYTDKYWHNDEMYRNPDCAYCNHVDLNVRRRRYAFQDPKEYVQQKWSGTTVHTQQMPTAEITHPDKQNATDNQEADDGKKTGRCSFLILPSVLQLHSFLPWPETGWSASLCRTTEQNRLFRRQARPQSSVLYPWHVMSAR